MTCSKLRGGALLALLLAALPATARAQESPARNLRGPFSVTVEWGGAVLGDNPTYGAPIFVGGTGSWWMEDYLLLEATGLYVFRDRRYGALAGPRFRVELGSMPVALSAGVRVGAMQIPLTGLRFTVSPLVGAEALLPMPEILFGLFYAPDVPVGGGGVNHRLYISLGYHF